MFKIYLHKLHADQLQRSNTDFKIYEKCIGHNTYHYRNRRDPTIRHLYGYMFV